MNSIANMKTFLESRLGALSLKDILGFFWWFFAALLLAALALDGMLFYRYGWQPIGGERPVPPALEQKTIERAAAILENRKKEFENASPAADLPNRFQ